MERKLEDLVETLTSAKERGPGCALLIGAGCSVKAGIPTAQGFVDIIKDRYPRAYERADQQGYQACMTELHEGQRRDLIAEHVDKAKINWPMCAWPF